MTLASNLYEEPKDTQAALEIAQSIIAAGRRGRADLSQHSGHAPPQRLSASASTPPMILLLRGWRTTLP